MYSLHVGEKSESVLRCHQVDCVLTDMKFFYIHRSRAVTAFSYRRTVQESSKDITSMMLYACTVTMAKKYTPLRSCESVLEP